MLVPKLHTAYSEFSTFCHGRPFCYGLSFEDVFHRLNKFNELNSIVMMAEAQFVFNSDDEEINYFKNEKSEFQQYGIFYELLYDIELKRRPLQKRYYKSQLKKLDKEFEHIEKYVIYCRSNSTENDHDYFRKSSDRNHIVSLVKANELLSKYLTHKVVGKSADEIILDSTKVKFNLTQNAIIEFAKALKGIGAAEGTLKDIAETLGRFFGVDMKNVYSKSNFISNRLNPAKFLEKMVAFLKKGL
jgi:hypothetical protein